MKIEHDFLIENMGFRAAFTKLILYYFVSYHKDSSPDALCLESYVVKQRGTEKKMYKEKGEMNE